MYLVQQPGEQSARDKCGDKPCSETDRGEPHSMFEDEREHMGATRAEGHANPDLARALRH